MSESVWVHVHRPSGHYIGQTRGWGRKRWTTVTGRCTSPEAAMARAVLKMRANDKGARVLFVDNSGWYEPNLCMECTR